MAKQKIVSVSGRLSTKSVDGERRIVFVASSNNEDRHYEHVDVASLRLPLKGGGDITVSAIPEEGISEVIDIPLMLNHSGDVRDVIGSIRAAYFSNNELTFEAGISKREIAQDMLTLLEEGHLSNAFSITMIDYDYNFDSETISKAEVIEVSLVYRGSNKEARLLAIKSLLGDKMPKFKQNDNFGDANGDGKDHTVAPEAPEVETPETAESPETADEAPTDEPETPETPESSEEEVADEPEGEAPQETPETNTNPEEEETMNKQIAKDGIMPKATPTQSSVSAGYLSTKAALVDFKNIVLKNHRGSNDQIMREWGEHLKSKGVTGDAIMPSEIENIFFKAWIDNDGILSTFRQVGARSGSVNAFTTEDTALGHKKGEKKKGQTLKNIRRDIRAKAIYKRLDIDLQDLFDDTTGELLKFRVEELASRVANAIAVGVLIEAGSGNDATLEGTRGLYPVVADAKDSSNGFGSLVSTKVEADGKDAYTIAVETIESVKGKNKILVVPEGFKKEIKLAKDQNGALLLPIGMKLEEVLEVKAIYEMPELNKFDSGKVKAIAYADQSIVLFGEKTATIRTDFDLDTNQDVMLVERYVGGSAQGYKTVAVALKA